MIKICRGIPASGKTTWAKEYCNTHEGWIRVNKDDLRKMLCHNPTYTKQLEKVVNRAEFDMVKSFHERGFNVIVDDTNISTKRFDTLRAISKYKVSIQDFTNVPLEVCLDRNAARTFEERIPDSVIINMYNDLKK